MNRTMNRQKTHTPIRQTTLHVPVGRNESFVPSAGVGNNRIPATAGPPVDTEPGIQYTEIWKVIRGFLVVWAIAVWLLLVMMPGAQQISDMATAMLHLPHMLIGLGLIGAIFASYSLRSDIHMLWFLGVLLLLAGWM